MKVFKFTAVLTREKEDGEQYYLVRVPALPEVVTEGNSIEEAMYMAQDAIELVLESRLEEGEAIPQDKKPIRVPSHAIVKELLASVTHSVKTTPLTDDVKIAFA